VSAAAATRTEIGTTASADDPSILRRYAAGPMPIMPVIPPAEVLRPKPAAPPVETPAPVEEPHRAMLLGQLLEAGNKVPVEDLRVLVWVARRLPIAALQAQLNARKEADREPALTRNNYTPTTREDIALGSLLGTLGEVALVVLGPKGGAR
jgi:hypothetical protein